MCHTGECGCGHRAQHHGAGMAARHGGCCHGPGHMMRRFPTREEILGEMEEYLEQLRTEVKGVEERIAEFRKAG